MVKYCRNFAENFQNSKLGLRKKIRFSHVWVTYGKEKKQYKAEQDRAQLKLELRY